eukprot:SAG22_NODE_3063_length_1970_cov_1.827365_1_plen_264_part_00
MVFAARLPPPPPSTTNAAQVTTLHTIVSGAVSPVVVDRETNTLAQGRFPNLRRKMGLGPNPQRRREKPPPPAREEAGGGVGGGEAALGKARAAALGETTSAGVPVPPRDFAQQGSRDVEQRAGRSPLSPGTPGTPGGRTKTLPSLVGLSPALVGSGPPSAAASPAAAAAQLQQPPVSVEVGARMAAMVRTKALFFCCASTVFSSKTVPFRAVPLDQPGRPQDVGAAAAGQGRGGGPRSAGRGGGLQRRQRGPEAGRQTGHCGG